MSRMVGIGIPGIVAVALAIGTSALAAPTQGKKELAREEYKDTRWGFSVYSFDKWTPIPPGPSERYVVGKFNPPEDVIEPKLGIPFRPSFTITRFDPQGKSAALMDQGKSSGGKDGPSTGDDGKRASEETREKMSLKNFEQALSNANNVQRQGKPEKMKFGKLEGTVYRYQQRTGIKIMSQHYAVAFNHEDGSQIVLDYEMPDFKFDDWKDLFVASAKTFKFTARESNDASRFDGLSPRDRDRLVNKEDVARTPGWKLDETPNYFIKYDIDNPAFIKEVKERIEAIRKIYEKDFGEKEATQIPVLRICKTEEEFQKYGDTGPGVGGWFNPRTKELVLPNTKAVNINETWLVLNHEGFHQFIYFRFGDVAPHPWFNEGTGDYYAGFRYNNGTFEQKPLGAWAGGYDRIMLIKEDVKKGKAIPLDKFLRSNARPNLRDYGQGWSVVYFLRRGKELGVKPWRASWDHILPDYFDVLLKTKDVNKAIESALKDLKGDSMKEFEETWKDFVLKTL